MAYSAPTSISLKIFFLLSTLIAALTARGNEKTAINETIQPLVQKADQNFHQGNYDTARYFYDQALEKLSPDQKPIPYVKISNKKLKLLLKHHKIIEYQPFCKKLLKVSRSIRSHKPFLYVKTLRLSAQTYLENKGNIVKGRQLLKKAENYHEKSLSSHYAELAFINNYLGLAAYFENSFDKSKGYLNKARALIKKHEIANPELKATTKRYIAHVKNRLGKPDSALILYKEAFRLIKRHYPDDHPRYYDFYYDLGITFKKNSQIDSALKYGFKALSILKKAKMVESIKGGLGFLSIGSCYYHKHDMQKSFFYHKRSLNIFKKVKAFKHFNYMQVYTGLGTVCRSLQYLDKSEHYLRKGLENAGKFKNSRKVRYSKGALYYNLGNTLFSKENYSEAQKQFKKGIEVYKTILPPQNPYINTLKVRLAKAYTKNNKLNKALKVVENQKDYYRKRADNPQFKTYYFRVKSIKASIMGKKGYLDSALQIINNLLKRNSINYYPKTPEINPSINEIIDAELLRNADILDTKGHLLTKMYNQQGKPRYLKAAFRTYSLLDSIHQDFNQKISLKKNKVYYKRYYSSHYALAMNTIHKLIKQEVNSEEKKQKYLDKAFYFAENDKASILMESLSEKAIQDSKTLPDSINKQLKRFQNQLKQIQKQINQTSDSLKRYRLQSKKLTLKNQQDKLHDTIKSYFPRVYYKNFQKSIIPLSELQQILKDHQKNLLQYNHHDSFLFVMVITPEKVKLKKTKAVDSLNSMIKRIRKGLIQQKSFKPELAHRLYKNLFQPIEPHLTQNELVIVPDGIMGYLPFEMLIKEKNSNLNLRQKPYLIKEYAFSYSPSATLWATQKPNHQFNNKKRYSGFAPSFDKSYFSNKNGYTTQRVDSLKQLPYAKIEIKKAKTYWEGKKYLEREATETRFKQKARKSSVIHLATHGFIDDRNPANNKLYFNRDTNSKNDGILHTYELYNLNLNADLAVLSACNTGVGKIREGSGIMSLAKGFKIVGCQNILMTLWPVNDKAGSNLINKFYHYLKLGYNKQAALRQAKLNYIQSNDPTNANPYFWAGFVLMGSEKMVKKPDFSYNWVFISISGALLIMLIIGLFSIRKQSAKAMEDQP